MTLKPPIYRQIIDALVEQCLRDQGQIGANRVRAGIWNANPASVIGTEQAKLNEVLRHLAASDRETLAIFLEKEFQAGVFEALKTLETYAVLPFDSGYESSPYEDFVGRLNGWAWPEE